MYDISVLRFVHQLSATLFYILGSSFFLSYLLVRNMAAGTWPAWWLQVADLPLAFVTILYGGLSLYLSVEDRADRSRALPYVIGIPMMLLFIFLVLLNFAPLFMSSLS